MWLYVTWFIVYSQNIRSGIGIPSYRRGRKREGWKDGRVEGGKEGRGLSEPRIAQISRKRGEGWKDGRNGRVEGAEAEFSQKRRGATREGCLM